MIRLRFMSIVFAAWLVIPGISFAKVFIDQTAVVGEIAPMLLGDDRLPAGAVVRLQTSKPLEIRYASLDRGRGQYVFMQVLKVETASDRNAQELEELNIIASNIGLFIRSDDVQTLEPSGGRFIVNAPVEIYRLDEMAVHPQQLEEEPGSPGKTAFPNDLIFRPREYEKDWVAAGVPQVALARAIDYYERHPNIVTNRNYIVVVDFTRLSNKKRLFVLNTLTGAMERWYAAHGSGRSGEVPAMKTTKFGNSDGSLLTPRGLHVSGFRYKSTPQKWQSWGGYGMRLIGQELGLNDNTFSRGVVFHGAFYARDEYVSAHGLTGRSNGCPASSRDQVQRLIGMLEAGVVWYHYSGT